MDEVLSNALTSLATIAASLDNTNQSVEPQFLTVGQRLQSIHTQACDLQQTATQAAELMGVGAEGRVLDHVDEIAGHCLQQIREWQHKISDSLSHVESVAEELGSLSPRSEKLRDVAKRLRVTSMYFAIESSRSDEATRVFSAFTQELGGLVKKIFEVTDSLRSDSVEARRKQMRAYDYIYTGSAELARLGDAAELSMQNAMCEVDQIITHSASAVDRVGAQSLEISKHIGNVVFAMQFRDISRQQVEHIVEALIEVKQMLEQLTDDSDFEAIGKIYLTVNLQAAQIRQVIAQLSESHIAINESFNEIGKHCGELAEQVAETDIHTDQINQHNHKFGNLHSALNSLCSILTSGQDLNNKTCETAEEAFTASNVLSSHVEQVSDINNDINIQALNAVINSVKLSEKGRALAILAEEVTALSNRCTDVADTIIESLQRVSSDAELMARTCNGNDESSCKHLGTLEQLRGVTSKISALGDGFDESSISITSQARELGAAISDIERELDFLPRLVDAFECDLESLESVSQSIKHLIPDDLMQNADFLCDHSLRYTMESERDIHRQITGVEDCAQTESAQEAADTGVEAVLFFENEDGLGDNVELF